MSSRSTSTTIPHRTSVSSTTSSHHSHPSQSSRPNPPSLTAQQLAERVISPGSVLFQHSAAPPSARRRVPERAIAVMDRRHPSSFQQLEKVCRDFGFPSFYSCVSRALIRSCSWVRGPTPPFTKAAIDKLESWWPSRRSTSTQKRAPLPPQFEKSV